MNIGIYLETFPELEAKCKEMLREKYIDMMDSEPLQEMEEYMITIGIKSELSRQEVFENFRVLFKDKTEELVKFMFETLAPQITKLNKQLLRQEQGVTGSAESPPEEIGNPNAHFQGNSSKQFQHQQSNEEAFARLFDSEEEDDDEFLEEGEIRLTAQEQ